jgi:hypothetical protein
LSDRGALDALLARHMVAGEPRRHQALRWVALSAWWWSILATGWALPVPTAFGRPGLWSALAAVALFAAAQRLSRAIALSLAAVMAAMLAATALLHDVLGPVGVLGIACATMVGSLLALVVAERRLGRPLTPGGLADSIFGGPIALAAGALRRVGVSP